MNLLPSDLKFGTRQPVKRLEDQRLITGRGRYTDDRESDGALWLYILRSPHAHARIVSMETGAALEFPGVAAVYTPADWDLNRMMRDIVALVAERHAAGAAA